VSAHVWEGLARLRGFCGVAADWYGQKKTPANFGGG